MHKRFVQGVSSAQAHCNDHIHTVDSIHGPGRGWAGGGSVGEVAKDPDKWGADLKFVNPTGWARVLDSRRGACSYFTFIMAAVQTEVSLCSQPWQRPLYIYGGLACNSLMAGELFSLSLWYFHLFFFLIAFMREGQSQTMYLLYRLFYKSLHEATNPLLHMRTVYCCRPTRARVSGRLVLRVGVTLKNKIKIYSDEAILTLQ